MTRDQTPEPPPPFVPGSDETTPRLAFVRYTAEHRPGVLDLILGIQQGEFGMRIGTDDQPDLLDIAGFYQRGGGDFWVALNGTDVIGTIALLDLGGGEGALRKMFVAPAWRKRRPGVIGTADAAPDPSPAVADRLLAALVGHAHAHRIERIYLGTTSWFHAAHRFYERHGFERIPAERLPAAFPIMSVDTRFYTLNTANVTGLAGPDGKQHLPHH